MNFKEWLLTESLNPKVLIPHIKHRKDERMSRNTKRSIHNDHLRQDYEDGMGRLLEIFTKENSLPVLMRKAMRQYEITRDRMHEKTRRDNDYMLAYHDTEPDNDLWMFCRALEDISSGNSPNLEEML
jgi:hypothetical protein